MGWCPSSCELEYQKRTAKDTKDTRRARRFSIE
jgi:hypothetical protein